MKLRFFFLALATGAIASLAIAVATLSWILAQSPLNLLQGGVTSYPQATMFVPQQAPAMISLLVNPEKLDALGRLAVPISRRRQTRQEWQKLKTNVLLKTGLDYRQDIQPWLGDEVTWAITSLDYDRNPDNGVQPGYLLAIQTQDTQLAKKVVQMSYSQQQARKIDLVFEQYKGVKIAYQRPVNSMAEPDIWASAFAGDFVLFANSPRILKEAINNAQAVDLNLEHASTYQDTLKTITEPRISLAYVNLPAASAWIAKQPTPETSIVKQIAAVTLSVQPKGLVAETVLIGVEEEPNRTHDLSKPIAALANLPPESILTVAGVDLNQFWQQFTAGLTPASSLTQLINQTVASLQAPLGIDLSQDIFPWVRGEYALALISYPDSKGLDWLFIAEKTPNTKIDAAIAHLDRLAEQQGLSVNELTVGNTQVTAWSTLKTAAQDDSVMLDTEVAGTHASTDQYEILASSVKAISQALIPGNKSLLQKKEFKTAVDFLPAVNDGYVYIDWQNGKSIFEQQIPLVRVLELSARSWFSHLRSLTLSSQGSENGVRRATVYFNLQA